MRNYQYMCLKPCYVDKASSTPDNPYRLTLYVDEFGRLKFAAEGNGCADDMDFDMPDDDDEINEIYSDFDTDILFSNANEISRNVGQDCGGIVFEYALRIEQARKS